MNTPTVYTYEQMMELDRLHRCAITARRAYHHARDDKSVCPGAFPFHLAQDYRIASKALADYLRGLKQQVSA